MARMNVYFPTEKEKRELEDAARKVGVSPSSLVRMALRKFYERIKHEEKLRKSG